MLTSKLLYDKISLLNKQIFENRIGGRKADTSELRQVSGSYLKKGADVW